MNPSLQEQLAYLERTINPNYLIIVRNKANETMDFSLFKPVTPQEPIKRTIKRDYELFIDPKDVHNPNKDTHTVIVVKDNVSGRYVFETTITKLKRDKIITKLQEQYKLPKKGNYEN